MLCKAQKESNSGINLPAGLSMIQGTQALAFVRQRYGLPHGDLDRIKRQQYFLKSVFHKLTTSGALLNPFTRAEPAQRGQLVAAHRRREPAQPGRHLLGDGRRQHHLPDDPRSTASATTTAGSVVLVTPSKVQAWVANLIGKGTPAADLVRDRPSPRDRSP